MRRSHSALYIAVWLREVAVARAIFLICVEKHHLNLVASAEGLPGAISDLLPGTQRCVRWGLSCEAHLTEKKAVNEFSNLC